MRPAQEVERYIRRRGQRPWLRTSSFPDPRCFWRSVSWLQSTECSALSAHHERFALKGALLLRSWFDLVYRARLIEAARQGI